MFKVRLMSTPRMALYSREIDWREFIMQLAFDRGISTDC
jgi:hypothetical protein